jgi:hypothetical protein
MNRLLIACVALSALTAASVSAPAAVIFHDDFENPHPVTLADDSFLQGTAPAGWSGSGGALWGLQDPSNATYTGTTGAATIANMDGRQIVSVFADNLGTLGNTTGTAIFTSPTFSTLTLGNFYTASIAIGWRGSQNLANVSLGYFFELRAGATVLESVSSSTGAGLSQNAFTLFTLSHIATGADPLGQQLSIRFGTNLATQATQSRATDFDNLTVSEFVPEPTGAMALAVGGCVSLLRNRRRHA